jgi:phage terminase large subunit-like protein
MDAEQEKVLIEKILKFKLLDHPILPNPSLDERLLMIKNVGPQSVMELFLHREQRAKAELDDPYRYGLELESWQAADDVLNRFNEILVLGGNRSGKTNWAAKRIVQAFVGTDLAGNMPEWIREKSKKRGINIWCLHTTNMTSVSMQQNVVYNYLPKELKEAKRTRQTQVSWTQKNGFSDNTAVYERNQIWFLNYAQDIKVVEGGEVDFVWCDELVPADWLETLKYRLVTRNGKLLVTFTPVQGYTQVVKEYITTSKVKSYRKSELLPNANVAGVPAGHMPYTAEDQYGKHGVVWFHSKLNPYNNWERMVQTLKNRSTHDIKIRAYGWAEQTAGSQFPLFGENNVFSDPIDQLVPEGTNYMVCDPAGARNWFMLWARVDDDGVIWVYREWPDISYGEWAIPGDKPDGRAGPAQRQGAGRGVDEYTELIWSLETQGDKREEIAERYIDPRSAGTETITKDGGITLLDLLLQASDPLYFQPSASVTVDERVLIINDLLCYNREISLERGKNHPKLMVHEDCRNLIYSLREWTGLDGQKGACKDPIDALGYMVVMQPKHISSSKYAKQWKQAQKCGSY